MKILTFKEILKDNIEVDIDDKLYNIYKIITDSLKEHNTGPLITNDKGSNIQFLVDNQFVISIIKRNEE